MLRMHAYTHAHTDTDTDTHTHIQARQEVWWKGEGQAVAGPQETIGLSVHVTILYSYISMRAGGFVSLPTAAYALCLYIYGSIWA